MCMLTVSIVQALFGRASKSDVDKPPASDQHLK